MTLQASQLTPYLSISGHFDAFRQLQIQDQKGHGDRKDGASLIVSLPESYEGALEITVFHLPRKVKHLPRVCAGMVRTAQTGEENRLQRPVLGKNVRASLLFYLWVFSVSWNRRA
jgi:hypothetical protein